MNSNKIALSLLPITPVSFKNDPFYAIGRIALYGTISYLTFKKYRTLSYVFMGMTGLSLLSSVTESMWYNQNKKDESDESIIAANT